MRAPSPSSLRADAAPIGPRSRGRAWWLGLALLAMAFVPFVQELTAQPAVRYAQTAALVEGRTVVLDEYDAVVGVDRVERDGHLYGDKAPLQPILAAPAYAVARLVGAEPATVLRPEGNLGLWWVTLWSTVVPLLAIAALGMRVAGRVVGPKRAVVASLTVCGGTLLAAYGTQLYAHVLAGLFGWSCWLVAERSMRLDASSRRGTMLTALGAGALGGAAVATEYPLLIVVFVVAGVLALNRAWRNLAAFVVGGLPFVALLGAYQWAAYGNPWAVSYAQKPVHGAEPLVIGVPNPLRMAEVLMGSRGLLLFSPVVALAVWGLVHLARSCARTEQRRHGVVGLVVFGGFLVLQSAWQNPWGGEAPGPRYVIPSLPFLIVGLAAAWDLAPAARRVAVRWSVLAMTATVVALHLTPAGTFAVAAQLQNLSNYGPTPTLWTLALGPFGWVLHLGSVAVLAWMVTAALRAEEASRSPQPTTVAEPREQSPTVPATAEVSP